MRQAAPALPALQLPGVLRTSQLPSPSVSRQSQSPSPSVSRQSQMLAMPPSMQTSQMPSPSPSGQAHELLQQWVAIPHRLPLPPQFAGGVAHSPPLHSLPPPQEAPSSFPWHGGAATQLPL